MARLTWKNVAAPNFQDSVYATQVGGQMLGSAFEDASALAAGIQEKKDAAAAARQKAVEDAALQRALVSFDPNDPNSRAAALAAAPASRMEDALARFSDISGLATDRTDRASTVASTERTRVETLQDSFDFKKAVRDDNRSEADRAAGQWADGQVGQFTRGTTSRDEAARRIAQNSDLSAEEKKYLTSSLEGVSDKFWAVDPTTGLGVFDSGKWAAAKDQISVEAKAAEWAQSSNKIARYAARGFEVSDGAPDGPMAVIEFGRSQIGADEESLFRDTPGEIAREYNSIASEFPDIPPEVISGVMVGELESARVKIRSSEELATHTGQVRKILREIQDNPRLFDEMVAYERERDTIAAREALYNEAVALGKQGMQRGNEDMVIRGEQIMEQLLGSGGTDEIMGGSGDSAGSTQTGNTASSDDLTTQSPASQPGDWPMSDRVAESRPWYPSVAGKRSPDNPYVPEPPIREQMAAWEQQQRDAALSRTTPERRPPPGLSGVPTPPRTQPMTLDPTNGRAGPPTNFRPPMKGPITLEPVDSPVENPVVDAKEIVVAALGNEAWVPDDPQQLARTLETFLEMNPDAKGSFWERARKVLEALKAAS